MSLEFPDDHRLCCHMLPPGERIHLPQRPTDVAETLGLDKKAAKARLDTVASELRRLQRLLYASHSRAVLVVLQGMDTSGKSGTIRHVFRYVDPLGVRAVSFKEPNQQEADRDYLWRIHREVPARGELVIFDRSHYEDVGVARVHGAVGTEHCRLRYAHIRDFERLLVEEGTTVLKFFLHISEQEQRKRLQARLDKPHKRWKLAPSDFTERKRWSDYLEAYSDALSETSTDWAPWYVVPADRRWLRNLAVGEVIVGALRALELGYPEIDAQLGPGLLGE